MLNKHNNNKRANEPAAAVYTGHGGLPFLYGHSGLHNIQGVKRQPDLSFALSPSYLKESTKRARLRERVEPKRDNLKTLTD